MNILSTLLLTLFTILQVEIPFRDGDVMPDFSRVGLQSSYFQY